MKVSFQKFGLCSIYDHNWGSYLTIDTIPAGQLVFGELIYLSDVLLVPEQGIFGIVRSFYSWSDLSFLANYNVQFAMKILRENLQNTSVLESGKVVLLKQLIEKVYDVFQNIDVRSHLAQAQRLMSLPNLGETYQDVNIRPNVTITLGQFQKRHLSIVSLGGALVSVIGRSGYKEVLDYEDAKSLFTDWGRFLGKGEPLPAIETRELLVEPDDLVVLATFTLGKVIRKVQSKPFPGVDSCDAETANQYLLTSLKTLLDDTGSNAADTSLRDLTESLVASFGGAWITACPTIINRKIESV